MAGTSLSASPDILVVGGGPAGATAARLLAQWDWDVLLAHRPSNRPTFAESLPPSIKKLLSLLGQAATIGSADFYPNDGNIGCWAGAMRDTHTDEPGFHVSRRSFDALLRQSARGAGVAIVDSIVRHLRLDDDGPAVELTTLRGTREIVRPRFLLDCSGRASIVARRGGSGRESAPYRTLALAAEWESTEWPASERTRTFVESFGNGWAWSVPLTDQRRQVTVMIDPHGIPLEATASRHTALQQIYTRALGGTHHLRARTSRASQTTRPWGANASVYRSLAPAAPRVLLAGDAASFIEPLSSAGVRKSMMSAWRAAVVANTCLVNPAMAACALTYHADRERQVFMECQRIADGFFGEAASFHGTPFWAARAAPAHAAAADDMDELVKRAHAQLRGSDGIRVRPAAALRFGTAPDIEGREVVLREAILVPGSDTPIRFAAGVSLPALVRLAAEFDDVPGILSAYHAHVGPAPIENLVTGLSVLVARRALILEDSRR